MEAPADGFDGPEPRETDPLRIVTKGQGFLLLSSRQLFVSVHSGPTTMESVRADSAESRRLGADGLKRGCLVVLEPDTAPPEAEVRAEMQGLLSLIAPLATGLAMVIEGEGFRSAALRAIFTGLRLVARQSYPIRVFSSAAQALVWLSELQPLSVSDNAVRLDALRREADGLP